MSEGKKGILRRNTKIYEGSDKQFKGDWIAVPEEDFNEARTIHDQLVEALIMCDGNVTRGSIQDVIDEALKLAREE